jgi:thiamine biosynthesis lipoprotein
MRPRTVAVLFCALMIVIVACSISPERHTQAVLKRAQMHMRTVVSVTVVAADKDVAHRAATAAFREVRRLDELFSTWIVTSELSGINAAAGRRPIPVSRDTMDILERSLEIGRLTNGGFNIAIGPAVEAWGVTERQHIPTQEELDQIRPLIDLSQVHVNKESGTVYLARQGMRVDVGGIGKGYAADRVVEAMRKAGATAGVVALSGDMKTFGRLPDGGLFPFGIRHPRKPESILAFIDLQDEAISTAGDYERFFERDGVRYHHILDPVALRPAGECQSVTVVAREGVLADGLDTGIFVLGPQRGMQLVEELDGVEAVIVDREGRMMVSSGLQDRVRRPSE